MAVLHSDLVSSLTLSGGLAIFAAALVLYTTIRTIHNVFFHPLSKIPGPKLYATTQLPYLWHLTRGQWISRLSDLHDQYGPVVRYAPNDVSFITADAYKNIYGHKTAGAKIFEKDLRAYRQKRPAPNLITANHEDHKRQRKLLSHAFSQKALRGQEGLIKHYVDLFIERLTRKARQGETVNMVAWYNFATFDLIGHLALGQPFGCLESGNYHPWVRRIFNTMKSVSISQALVRLGLRDYISLLTPKRIQKATDEHWQFTEHTAGARLDAKDNNSQDFMSYILRYNDERGMSRPEILENSSLLIVAGSETTATLLSGATYFLLNNLDKYDKLVEEIRSTFSSEEEITANRVDQLKYLLAVLSETFRLYPPVAVGLPRITPAGGEFMEGYYIPEKTSVSVPQLPAYKSSQNFRNPEQFVPERWLDDPLYANDSRAVVQPFSMGPRDCLGKNLAYVEMRLLLTRLLWKFDLELMPDSKDWYDQKIYISWEKNDLNVKLTEVVREKQ
ncbi:hypothetical protein NW768_011172 [Fusarium equiseti]|uniref:Isotrichodermin C-15 hydroxylase n=1 Tax=Fusarium equiseti TaxID=61235 RepID=A0ABQ8QYB0_FUSEQ|nr:hypothetical protein NW768_011172 [Fusarium equiseti]